MTMSEVITAVETIQYLIDYQECQVKALKDKQKVLERTIADCGSWETHSEAAVKILIEQTNEELKNAMATLNVYRESLICINDR
jgi:hypothetical protein